MSFQAMTWAIEQTPPDAESKLLLLLLANYAGHDNSCWPSVSTLSKQATLCETTVRDRLRLLAEAGLIAITPRRTERGDATSNLYTLRAGEGGRPTRPPHTSPGEAPPSRRDPPLPRAMRSNQSVEPIIDPKEKNLPAIKYDASTITKQMHTTFCTVTGTEANLMAHERTWLALANAGYTPLDVEIFLRWVDSENKAKEDPRFRRKPHIARMFSDHSFFDADLSLAKAWYRNRRGTPTARETALEQLRPTVDPELAKARLNPAQSAGEVLGRILRGQQ